jgi:hypothetical protein
MLTSSAIRRASTLVLGLGLGTVIATGARHASAGDLQPPPGALAPTMKTLVEAEPRIAVNAENTPGGGINLFRISEPGSYYLTENIVGQPGMSGIYITSDNVSLDLNGFALIGGTDSKDGIWASSHRMNIRVRNGIVTLWGEDGVAVLSDNSVFEDLRISQCGGGGLINYNGYDGIVRRVVVFNVGSNEASYSREGIFAGQCALVEECVVRTTGEDGIKVGYNSIVRACTVSYPGATGIYADTRCLAEHCRVSQCGTNGIRLGSGSAAVGNTAVSCGYGSGVTDGAGIVGAFERVRVEGNHISLSDVGIRTEAVDCLVIGNSSIGNTTDFDLASGTVAGPIITSANIATEDSAHANYAW